MSAPPTEVFGLGLARTMQVVFALQGVVQLLLGVSAWRQDGGPSLQTALSAVTVVLSLVVVAFAETSIVRVGPDRVRWRDRLGRRIDLAVDEVADVRRHPATKNRVQLVTTDGRVLPLPVQRDDGPKVWWLVLGDRAAGSASDRG